MRRSEPEFTDIINRIMRFLRIVKLDIVKLELEMAVAYKNNIYPLKTYR